MTLEVGKYLPPLAEFEKMAQVFAVHSDGVGKCLPVDPWNLGNMKVSKICRH